MTRSSSGLTVLLPNYNDAEYLAEALESVVGQDLPADEILVVDDGSTDGSRPIIERYAARYPNVRPTYFETNRGANAAVDHLMSRATGEFLFPIGADDRALPGFFRKAVGLLRRWPEAALATGLCRTIGEDGRPIPTKVRGVIRSEAGFVTPAEAKRRMVWHGPWISGNAVVYRRDMLEAAGGFRRELGPYCDGFIQEVLTMRRGSCFIPEYLTCWRWAPRNYSTRYGQLPENQRHMRDVALALMQSDYADVFDATLRSIFRRRMDCQIAIAANDLERESRSGLSRTILSLQNLALAFERKTAYLAHTPPWEWPQALGYFARSQWVARIARKQAERSTGNGTREGLPPGGGRDLPEPGAGEGGAVGPATGGAP